MDEAALLMDRPPGGWGELATRHDLEALEARVDRRFAEMEQRFDLKIDALRHELTATMEAGFRAQTWRLLTALIAAMGIFAAIVRV